jgi:hypothetical protein
MQVYVALCKTEENEGREIEEYLGLFTTLEQAIECIRSAAESAGYGSRYPGTPIARITTSKPDLTGIDVHVTFTHSHDPSWEFTEEYRVAIKTVGES